jgi:hypothetical protein
VLCIQAPRSGIFFLCPTLLHAWFHLIFLPSSPKVIVDACLFTLNLQDCIPAALFAHVLLRIVNQECIMS